MTDLSRLSPVFGPGTVWLVGAGPGDPGLLTVHALNALAQADVIVHDALIGEGVLAFARDGAELEYAGKRGGKPSAQQDAISERLIALARAGKRVLRLKGGVGYDAGRVLPYLALGFAQLDSDDLAIDKENGTFYGLGADFAVTDSIRLGAEYLRHDFDDIGLEANTLSLRAAYSF